MSSPPSSRTSSGTSAAKTRCSASTSIPSTVARPRRSMGSPNRAGARAKSRWCRALRFSGSSSSSLPSPSGTIRGRASSWPTVPASTPRLLASPPRRWSSCTHARRSGRRAARRAQMTRPPRLHRARRRAAAAADPRLMIGHVRASARSLRRAPSRDRPGPARPWRSGHLPPPYTAARLAEDLADLLDHLGVGAIDVARLLARAAPIAQQFVLDHPARCRRLVLACTYAFNMATLRERIEGHVAPLLIRVLGMPRFARLVIGMGLKRVDPVARGLGRRG